MEKPNIVQIGKAMYMACKEAAKAVRDLGTAMERLQGITEFTHVSKYHR
jgi:hypothetical protein